MSFISRRSFNKNLSIATLGSVAVGRPLGAAAVDASRPRVRLGGAIYKNEYSDPDSWIAALQNKGYTAARCPVGPEADDQTVRAYEKAAIKADIIIAEVGAWSNPLCPDEKVRKAAMQKCIHHLELADRIGARCCVNVSGTHAVEGIGTPHPENLKSETFDMIVESVRKIIDAVKPTRTYYTLETMPWAYPNSAQSVLDLIKAIDRRACAAHFDPVNLINSPDRYFNNAALLKEAFKLLGPRIRSCHAKDSLLSATLTTHLDEVVPGHGNLDYKVFLKELSKLDNVPLMMEHMKKDEYPIAAEYIRRVGRDVGIAV